MAEAISDDQVYFLADFARDLKTHTANYKINEFPQTKIDQLATAAKELVATRLADSQTISELRRELDSANDLLKLFRDSLRLLDALQPPKEGE